MFVTKQTPLSALIGSKMSVRSTSGGKMRRYWLLVLLPFAWMLLTYRTAKWAVLDSITPLDIPNHARQKGTALSRIAANKYRSKYHNNVTLETWYVLETEATTEGRYWRMYEGMKPKGFVNIQHQHPYQSEYIEVLEGSCQLSLDDRSFLLKEGQSIYIPAGVSHGLANPSHHSPVLLLVEYRPALRNMEHFFATLSGLSRQGSLGSTGIPDPIYVSMIWRRFPGISSFSWIPAPFQDLVGLVLPWIGDLLGYSLDDLEPIS